MQVEQDPMLGKLSAFQATEFSFICLDVTILYYILLDFFLSHPATATGRHRRQLGEPLDQSVTPCACCFVVTADNKHIMACGYWDNSFKCFTADSGKTDEIDILSCES